MIDHDPHTALGYIFAFREKKERGDDCWEVEEWSEWSQKKTVRGEYNGEKNALAN